MSRAKYVIVLADGAADLPVDALDGRTPLQAARTPNLDRVAREGRTGTLETVPEGMSPDSSVANLSVLGYDPRTAHRGRGVLEAASMGVALGPRDLAMRLNLVSVRDGRMLDHSAGHVSSDEGRALAEALHEALGGEGLEIHPGISYRHLLVLREALDPSDALRCFPPHDHVGAPLDTLRVQATAPAGEATAARLRALVEASGPVLRDHPVNRARRAAGRRTADLAWPWAPGFKPAMPTLQERFGVRGAVISAVDLIFGLGIHAGMTPIHVEGATGLHDTNYEGKAAAALAALDAHDLVFVHVEAADEAGHARDLDLKLRCIEDIDARLVAPILQGAARREEPVVVAVLPDHLTPVARGDHQAAPVPVAILDPERPADAVDRYDEDAVRAGALGAMKGAGFIEALLWREVGAA